jgi:hypothetical protein
VHLYADGLAVGSEVIMFPFLSRTLKIERKTTRMDVNKQDI